MARHVKPLTIGRILARIPKTGPREKALRCRGGQGIRCRHTPLKPSYDRDLRELSVDGHLIHTFAPQACKEIAILEMFEAEGWPARIEYRPAGEDDTDFEHHLHSAVSRLNKLRPELIRFSCDAKKRGIRWSFPA